MKKYIAPISFFISTSISLTTPHALAGGMACVEVLTKKETPTSQTLMSQTEPTVAAFVPHTDAIPRLIDVRANSKSNTDSVLDSSNLMDLTPEDLANKIAAIEDLDIDSARRAHDDTKKQLKLNDEIKFWLNLSGDNLHIIEFKWLIEEYVLKRNLKNGFRDQIFSSYRNLFRNMEYSYFEQLSNQGKINKLKRDGFVKSKEILKLEETNKKLFNYYAKNWMHYRQVRRFFDSIATLGNDAAPAEAKARSRQFLKKDFAAYIEDKKNTSIVQLAAEIEKGLHIDTLNTKLASVDDLYSLQYMSNFFYDPKKPGMVIFLKELSRQQMLTAVQRRLLDNTIRMGVAKIASNVPKDSRLAKLMQIVLKFDDTAFKQQQYLNDINEIMSSVGTADDKLELLFEKSFINRNNDSSSELQTLLFVHTTGVLTKRVQLVQKRNKLLGAGNYDIVMQKTDSPLTAEEQEKYKDAATTLVQQLGSKNLITLKESQRSHILETKTVKANDFLVYMYRLVNTNDEWISLKARLQERAELEKDPNGKSISRLANMDTAEQVGNELGEVAFVEGHAVQIWRFFAGVGLSVAATPEFVKGVNWAATEGAQLLQSILHAFPGIAH